MPAGGGGQNWQNLAYVVYGCPLTVPHLISYILDAGKGKTGEVSEYVSVKNIDCSSMSICEADVILIDSLQEGNEYVLSLEVKDTNGETTIVESILQATSATGPFIG